MKLFLAGIAFGGISGGVTYALTTNTTTALIVAAAAAILTWIGWATLIIIDD